MLKEFKEFAMRGNAVDLAVGVIIGAAFGKIVTSLVEDVLMPPIGQLLGKHRNCRGCRVSQRTRCRGSAHRRIVCLAFMSIRFFRLCTPRGETLLADRADAGGDL